MEYRVDRFPDDYWMQRLLILSHNNIYSILSFFVSYGFTPDPGSRDRGHRVFFLWSHGQKLVFYAPSSYSYHKLSFYLKVPIFAILVQSDFSFSLETYQPLTKFCFINLPQLNGTVKPRGVTHIRLSKGMERLQRKGHWIVKAVINRARRPSPDGSGGRLALPRTANVLAQFMFECMYS